MAGKKGEFQKAQKILNYWYTIEFLAQDKYDDMWETRAKMQKAQQDFKLGRCNQKTIWSYHELCQTQTIYDVVSADAISCGMKRWGNITVFIGKIKREVCIECIAKAFPQSLQEERPEQTKDCIAWASLQIAPDGTYVDHSLSLSTIIWSMNQIKNSKGRMAECIDEKEYRSAVEALETSCFGKEKEIRPEPEASVNHEAEKEEAHIGEFATHSVSAQQLNHLYKQIEKEYILGNVNETGANQEYQEVYGLYFQLFADEQSKNKLDEDNYLGLSHDYFSEDIKMLHEKAMDGASSSSCGLSDDLVRYLTVLGKEDQNEKIDLIQQKDRNKFYRQISELLEVGNAPLGKWPSKYMPAFMQQVAINLCIRKGTSDLYGVNGNIFSVNGPPGTGKTTLLKEIVVSNIIERAILLAEYEDPDDAFEKHSFLHGEKQEHAYSTYTRGWYSLKNDRINDYSTLVTSCNNAAVENVSKELPLGRGFINDLKPSSQDTEEYAGMLKELSGLFDPSQSQIYETIGKQSCQDVYFTKYAGELFDSDGVWGLIAAPLGKKSNITNFFNHVLYPMYWDFYLGKEFKDVRLLKYAIAKEEFEQQLKVVKDLQQQLKDLCTLVKKRSKLLDQKNEQERKLAEQKSLSLKLFEANERNLDELQERMNELIDIEQDVLIKRDAIKTECLEIEIEAKGQFAKKKELLEKAAAARRATGVLDLLFHKKKVEANEQLAAVYDEDVVRTQREIDQLEARLTERNELLYQAENAGEQVACMKQQVRSDIAEKEQAIHNAEKSLCDLERKRNETKAKLANLETAYKEKAGAFTAGDSLDTGLILDESFVEKLLSEKNKVSTSAQTSNPWFTKRYDIEREKLFYYAMKLEKEFVLSSKSCRDNFKTLGHYWGMLQGDEKERIVFHQEDKKRFAGALYQTLFLLVPVLSSTFASLGTFLRDAKQPGVIGTLVVDEAGQAQPQMAAGALYRSRKAMIVGDPKQVEPVVTDDLNMLKNVFDDEELRPYKSKTVSVQSVADMLNSFGTYLENGTDYSDWVGCPLLVHRRCLSPMYDISNEISYHGMMKQQTREPDTEKAASFLYDKSQWINVAGTEKGSKNHFVEEQAKKVCEMLETAFSNSDNPNIYIISPFTSVVSGMKAYLKDYKRKTADTNLGKCDAEWISRNIGTVHTFQGKEADEVIFLLGCDNSKQAQGAIRWVNTNIVNVAATRAKFRLYVIGDEKAWEKSSCVKQAKTIMDTFAIKKIKDILEDDLPKEEEKKALAAMSASLPPVTFFVREVTEDETGTVEYSADTDSLLQGLEQSFIETSLTKEQLGKFGFRSMEQVWELQPEIRNNLLLGMKLFYLLQPVFDANGNLDASCCAILFCKALELQLKECFTDSLKALFPEFKIKGQGKGRGWVELKDAEKNELTLGAFLVLLKANNAELAKNKHHMEWWETFESRLSICVEKRNNCCHSGFFGWKDQSHLLANMFKKVDNGEVQMEGILFESKIGKTLLRSAKGRRP